MKFGWALFLTGSGIVLYRYNSVAEITIKLVDWENQLVKIEVRGDESKIDADTIFRTGSTLTIPIKFNRYVVTATKNQTYIGAPNVLRVCVSEGNTLIGQPIYIDFDKRTIEGDKGKK